MDNLLNKKCAPCEDKNAKPFNEKKVKGYLAIIPKWKVDKKIKKIYKEFKFDDFVRAMKFIKKVADISESEGHHPDIHIYYNKVLLELTTHSVGGLSENDFILAAKIDTLK